MKQVKSILLIALFLIACEFLYFIISDLYNSGKIFPPKLPNTISDIQNWSENDLHRLANSLQCWDLPFDTDQLPNEMKKLAATCDYVTHLWSQKYNQEKLEKIKVPDGLK